MPSKKGTSRAKRNALVPSYCEIPGCGYNIVIQKHRIYPGRNGGKYEMGNTVGLCPNHHAQADRTLEGRIKEGQRGYLPASHLKQIVDERIRNSAATKFIQARTGSPTFQPAWVAFGEEPAIGHALCWSSEGVAEYPVVEGRCSIVSNEIFEHTVEYAEFTNTGS